MSKLCSLIDDIILSDQSPTLKATLDLNYFHKGLIPHAANSELGHQHMNIRET